MNRVTNNLHDNLSGRSYLLMKLSIWSTAMVTSITGLAISPILPDIHQAFPHVKQSDVDMLISFPNLLLIPFVLLTGKIATSKNRIVLITTGSLFFILSAIAYQFATTIHLLLGVSILLGIGAGLIVPLSVQLPTIAFRGKKRQRQLGICSGIANVSQVICTFLAGWLATISWRDSFWVYAIAIIPLAFTPFLKNIRKIHPLHQLETQGSEFRKEELIRKEIDWKKLLSLMVLYFTVTFFNLQIPLSLPFLLARHHLDSEISGILIGLFFSMQALVAFNINSIIRLLKTHTMTFSLLIITLVLLLLPSVRSIEWYYPLAALAGITGGIIEPLVWNKTVHVSNIRKSSVAFGWIMSSNYLSIWATPYILSLLSHLFHDDLSTFPFYISGTISLMLTVLLFIFRRTQIFGMKYEMQEYSNDLNKK